MPSPLINFNLKDFTPPKAKTLAKKAASHFLKKYTEEGGDFFDVPLDESVPAMCSEFARHAKRFREIVLVGIGGSSLGAQTILHAFPPQKRKFFFLDNLDPDLVSATLSSLSWEKTLFLVVSKSGTTAETLSQFFLIEKELNRRSLPINEHIVTITDISEGPLWEFADQSGSVHFPIPRPVGGRFSVLTSVGLLPAALAGLDPHTLIKGARNLREEFLEQNTHHPLAIFAASEYLHSTLSRTSRVTLAYNHRLQTFLAWYCQLLAESCGKQGKGITPLFFTGVTDQHSSLQLYLDGPSDKFFVFLHTDKFETNTRLPGIKHPKLKYLSRRTLTEIFHAEEDGTYRALKARSHPVSSLSLTKLTPESLGALFFAAELEIALLGILLKINPYDQPAVEEGKHITKKTLLQLQKKTS